MRPEIAATAHRQHGLITRWQAVQAGWTERELRTMTAVHGPWVIVRRGVYVERERWSALASDDQWRLRDQAAHLNLSIEHVFSHDSAARACGIPLLRPRAPLVHITRPGVSGSRTEHGICHHLTRLGISEGVSSDGLPVTTPARTALDLAREHGLAAGLVACDDVLRRGTSRNQLLDELEKMTNWPHVTKARAAVEHANPGAESPGESLARLLVEELGFGRPEAQFPVEVDRRVLWADLRLGRHLFEFDGRIKYRDRRDGGVAERPAEEVVWAEKRRQERICSQGFGMSRIVWDDFWGAARPRALEQLRAEYLVTYQRFGFALTREQARFAAEKRGLRLAS